MEIVLRPAQDPHPRRRTGPGASLSDAEYARAVGRARDKLDRYRAERDRVERNYRRARLTW